MNREFKKNFFSCLLAVLLVISNILCKKLTMFINMPISVEFITFPFTFLCTLLIVNLGDKKDAYRSILSASVIQLLITISYTIAINLENQSVISDHAIYINQVFQIDQYTLLKNVLAFILSHCLLVYVYDIFKEYGKEFFGVMVGLIGGLFLNVAVSLMLPLRNLKLDYVIDKLRANVIMNAIMVVVITIIFYILKEHHKEKINTKGEKVVLHEEKKIEEKPKVVEKDIKKEPNKEIKKEKEKITSKNSVKNTKKTPTKSTKTVKKKTNNKKEEPKNKSKNTAKKTKISKKNVNKENN